MDAARVKKVDEFTRLVTFDDGYEIRVLYGWTRHGGYGWTTTTLTGDVHTYRSIREAATQGRRRLDARRRGILPS